MKTIHIILIIFFILAVVSLLIFAFVILNQNEEFCESEGGEYLEGECLIKEEGIYESYKIRRIKNKHVLVK